MLENITTLEQLKKEYRALAMQYHPDCGGSDELMKELNNRYDVLFPILKKKSNTTSSETASSTRSEFYTQNGWKGSNYDRILSLKEIANIIRAYVKSVYPEFKFSITTHYASMCQSLDVAIVQGDCEAYKKPDEWTQEEQSEATQQIFRWEAYHYTQEQIEKMKQTLFMTDRVKAVKEDVDRLVNSYNYDDSDGMIDYFDCNFYYTGGASIGTYDKPYTVKEYKGKKTDVVYEPVKEMRKKVKKYKKIEEYEVTTFKAKHETGMTTQRKSEAKKQEQANDSAKQQTQKTAHKTAEERKAEVMRKNAELKAQREARKAQQQEQNQEQTKEDVKNTDTLTVQKKQPEKATSQPSNDKSLTEKENATQLKKQALQTAQKVEGIAVEIIGERYKYTELQRQPHTKEFKALFLEKLQPIKGELNSLVIDYVDFDEIKEALKYCMSEFEKVMEE